MCTPSAAVVTPLLCTDPLLQKQSAFVRKSFIAQFLNTAIIAIVVNARLPDTVDNPLKVRCVGGLAFDT